MIFGEKSKWYIFQRFMHFQNVIMYKCIYKVLNKKWIKKYVSECAWHLMRGKW